MKESLIARIEITIHAPVDKVWKALTDPSVIKQYMFGTEVVSKWKEGSPITWKGGWQGKQFEDRGTILQVQQNKRLQYSHFSPLSELPDIAENYHTVTIDLVDKGSQTLFTLSQDKNITVEAKEHSEKNWRMMLESLKKLLEQKT